MRKRLLLQSTALLLNLAISISASSLPAQDLKSDRLAAIRTYIKQGWRTLTRSNARLADAAVDPKLHLPSGSRWPVYVSRQEDLKQIEDSLRSEMAAGEFAKIELRVLPDDQREIKEHGLLYLPHPYVVPGGRFNEMYGWDSYFIQVGLLRDGELELARGMVDNFIYEVERYGKVLNANRTYYLTRSQPPFLTQMTLGVYRQTHDKKWLARAAAAIEKYYRYWTDDSHLNNVTGLSRYLDLGEGPAPEVIADERDAEGKTHYDRVREYFRSHKITDYDLDQYYDIAKDQLTPLFYKGDRSMRESGFDPSNRFGQFNIDIIHYNPVCLNSLLFIMESETAQILQELGRRAEAVKWNEKAAIRRVRINRLMWDEKDGLYYDYNFQKKEIRRYPFATTFYPLWAGLASRRQAARLVANLKLFERPGGIQTSTNESGNQWDAPFGWAPLEMIAEKGLRKYGYVKEANRISMEFLSMVLKDFNEHNVIVEKYDVANRRSQVSAGIKFGYSANQIGFGWTNAAFVEMYADLTPGFRTTLAGSSGR